MKILWITNMLFPEPQKFLTGSEVIKGGGGWMTSAADVLSKTEGVQLYVATVSPLVNELTTFQGNTIKYYILPYGKGNNEYNPEYEPFFKMIQEKEQLDIIHIHGTEFTQGLAYVNSCGANNVVVSIQGMKSVIADYYCAGISFKDRLKNITVRDILKGGITKEASAFRKQGKNEIKLISKVNHIIGRTSWDKAHTWSYNPSITYHHCDEILRPEFYISRKWKYNECRKHSIFLSQAWYPLKGAHQVFKAVRSLISKYPDLEIRIAGDDITRYASIKGLVHYNTYSNYLSHLIKKYHLRNHVFFTGPLSTKEMINEYLNCNIFICPSSIENSPNSLGEAQILGVPCIASYAGGIPDMMKGQESYLYRFEDVKMLAYLIDKVFRQGADYIGIINEAERRHNYTLNNNRLLEIYNTIIAI